MSDDRKKYDTDDKLVFWNARLAMPAEVKEMGPDKAPLVRLKVVSTSRSEKAKDIWLEVTPGDRDANLAAYLEKGDTFGFEGKPEMEEYTGKDGTARQTLKIKRATLHVSIDLLMKCKERGFTPGAKSISKAGGVKPAPRPTRPTAKPVLDVDFGDD
jgi:single-stranded DNA-binding protein